VRLTGSTINLDERDVMATKRKVSISTGPTNHRQSSSERHAAYVAQIANRQTELKNEAAARRAKRAAEDGEKSVKPPKAPPETSPEVSAETSPLALAETPPESTTRTP
jgi:hypothetical protein